MGWFSKGESKPDPIGDICRLLVDKPWEWNPNHSDEDENPAMEHISGVFLSWNYDDFFQRVEVFLGHGGEDLMSVSKRDGRRLYSAILGNAAARAMRPRVEFDAATRAVAKAVLDGDVEAARQLTDWVMEHCGATTPEGT